MGHDDHVSSRADDEDRADHDVGPEPEERPRPTSTVEREDVAVFLAVVLLHVVVQGIGVLRSPLPLSPTGATVSVVPAVGVVLVASLCFGSVGVLGSGVGYLLGRIVSGSSGGLLAGGAVATALFGLTVITLWGSIGNGSTRGGRDGFDTRWFVELAVVAVLSSLAAGVGAASVVSLLGDGPFYLYAPSIAGEYLVSAILVGVPLLSVVLRVSRAVDLPVSTTAVQPVGSPVETKWIAALLVGWLLVGSLADLGFTLLRTPPPTWYRSRFGVEFSVTLVNTLQAFVHLLVVSVVATLFVGRDTVVAWVRRRSGTGSTGLTADD